MPSVWTETWNCVPLRMLNVGSAVSLVIMQDVVEPTKQVHVTKVR